MCVCVGEYHASLIGKYVQKPKQKKNINKKKLNVAKTQRENASKQFEELVSSIVDAKMKIKSRENVKICFDNAGLPAE